MKKIKACIITGSRAEWGLFYPLAVRLKSDSDFDLRIIATAGHLSGATKNEIKDDGFNIDARVAMPLKEDTEEAIAKAVGIGTARITDVLDKMAPDIVFLLGDRFETFAAATAAYLLKVPIAHIHGGELTQGSIDEGMRHAITKMSSVHFVSTDVYRKRVIQMGEDPQRVFNVGALGLDNIKDIKPLKKDELEKRLGFKLGRRNAMVTYNPSTAETKETMAGELKDLLDALSSLKDVKVIFTKPNVDIYSNAVVRMIDTYIYNNKANAKLFSSMGRELYLNTLRFMDVVAGNSSSGIIEAPSFAIPTVNLGSRQTGRVRADSVIDVERGYASLTKAFEKAFSSDFKSRCRKVNNPYGDGEASGKIVNFVKKLDGLGSKKTFLDVNFNLPI